MTESVVAAVGAESAATDNDGHTSSGDDDDDDDWDSGGGADCGSSSDDGWESEDEEERFIAAMEASGGMISPSVSHDSLNSANSLGEAREGSLRDEVSRAPAMRRMHLQLSGLGSSTTPCDVVFGDAGANMSLVLVCKAARMTGVTPRGQRCAHTHLFTL